MSNSRDNCNQCLDCFVWLCRIWGLITAVGLWGVGVETSYRGHLLGAYIVAAACVMTFLECVFIINFCIIACAQSDPTHRKSVCRKLWDAVIWLDNWKKGLLYLFLAVPCFIEPSKVWMAIIPGVMVVISSIFYFIKTIHQRRVGSGISTIEETYDRRHRLRFEEIEDDLFEESGHPTEDGTLPIDEDETVAEQDEILDV